MDRKMERSTNDDWTGRWAKLRADVREIMSFKSDVIF
jgi:hypothetical protein